MTRTVSPENQAALSGRRLVARDFVWIQGWNRSTGAVIYDGVWSGLDDINAEVVDPETGGAVTRPFYGSGALVSISDIPLVSNLQVQTIRLVSPGIHAHMEQLVREYDIRHGKIEIYRGLYDPDTELMVAPAENRFAGTIDSLTITTPEEGGEGGIDMECTSSTQEVTRSNPATRSHEDQKLRDPTDMFFRDSSTVTEWIVNWGNERGKVPTQKKRKKFLGIF